ncbi:MAG: UPF0149 family protein [Nitrospina sp.]|nr:UPF0149 family protein [Nitrospina sp.]
MDTPLSAKEYDELENILNQFQKENVMNVEGIEGLFTALISSPEMTQPNIYLREIWGDKGIPANDALQNDQETQDFMNLLMRHWNTVVNKLNGGGVFIPVFLKDPTGITNGNDWAQGYVRGVQLHQEDWSGLLQDKENANALIPIVALAHEHDPDPKKRTYDEPISQELRKQLIAGLSTGAKDIYKYFEPHRHQSALAAKAKQTFKRETVKVGRNEPCPCGSGRKSKRCCGEGTKT